MLKTSLWRWPFASVYQRPKATRVFCAQTAVQETLQTLEWSRLCDAVSSFASTSMGKQRIQELELPSSRAGSEMLLSQTRAALEFEAVRGNACEIGSIDSETIKLALQRASKGAALSGIEAAAVATMLERARSLRNAALSCTLEDQERNELLGPVVSMLSSVVVDPDNVKEIWNVVDNEGSVKDSASLELRKARMQEQSADRRLQDLLRRIVYERLADDPNAQVVKADERLCLAVSSDSSPKVPGLLLQSSLAGTILYVEPSAAVSLNNILSQARAEVVQAEYRALVNLTEKLRPSLENFRLILNTIVDFDVVLARARYGSSLGAAYPEFVCADDKQTGTGENFLVRLEGTRHPLLVQQHQESLRNAKSELNSTQKSVGRMKSRAYLNLADLNAEEKALAETQIKVSELESSAPVPIDFLVKKKTKVVTITGPNTGGKTAAIKTLGIAALMARAGLYVLAKDPARLPWFSTVLADIGDQQSLSQSLSTFSGHLLKVKKIQAESTASSLVLLDEVGTGTDFVEGAALGMAMLEHFAQEGCCLALATTHHGELKMLKYSDSRFENASVEFDEENLRPTYRLLWGIPGRSNALNIAARLGLPNDIIAEAKSLHGAANTELNDLIMQLEQARQSFERNFVESQRLLDETKKHHRALIKAAQELEASAKSLNLDKSDQLEVLEAQARSRLNRMAQESRR